MSYFEVKLIMENVYVAFDMEKYNFYKLWGFDKCSEISPHFYIKISWMLWNLSKMSHLAPFFSSLENENLNIMV